MRNPIGFVLQQTAIWAYKNPLEAIGIGYLARYQAPRLITAGKIYGRYQASIMPARIAATRSIGQVLLGARGVASAKVASKAGIYGVAAAVGVGVGVVAGTAISSAVFGPEGKDKAIQFYTGGADLIDYIPHYNAYKIMRHYAQEAIE
jgi:hypothetical protein